MTSLPPRDPLAALWQTAPKPEAHRLLRDLQRLNRLHRRFNRSVYAILFGIAILLMFEEATGRVRSHGVLSAIWTLGLLIGIVWYRGACRNRRDALTLDTVSLLKFMIKRAKSDLFVARCLYAGVPCGAAVGYLAAKLAGIGPSPLPQAINPLLDTIQTGSGIAALVIMIVSGAVLARSRSLQVRHLSDKLKSIAAEL